MRVSVMPRTKPDAVLVRQSDVGFFDGAVRVVEWPRKGVSDASRPFDCILSVVLSRVSRPFAVNRDDVSDPRSFRVNLSAVIYRYTSGVWVCCSGSGSVDVRRLLDPVSCTSYHRRVLRACMVGFSFSLMKENVSRGVTYHSYVMDVVKCFIGSVLVPYCGESVDFSVGLYYLAYYGRCLDGDEMLSFYELLITACLEYDHVACVNPLSDLTDANDGTSVYVRVSESPPVCLEEYKRVKYLRRWLARQYPVLYGEAREALYI